MSLFDDDFAIRLLSQFARDPGAQSGRLSSSVTFETFLPQLLVVEADTYQIPHPHGHMFCLGHDAPGVFGFFYSGEKVELTRGFTVTNETRIHFCARFRPPRKAPPPGYAWRFQVLINGVFVENRDLPKQIFGTDSSTAWTSIFVNVSKLSGITTLTFRLLFDGPGGVTPAQDVEIPAVYLDSVVLRGDRTALVHFSPFFGNFNPEVSAGFTSPIAPL